MASELYVETLKGLTSGANANKIVIPAGQTLDASAGAFVPSSGQIVQVLVDTDSTARISTSTAYVDLGLSVAITPKSASNYFLVTVEGHFSTATVGGLGFNIFKDDVAVTSSPTNSPSARYDMYDQYNDDYNRSIKTYYAVTGTTSEVTFTVKFSSYNTSTVYNNATGDLPGSSTTTLTVMEIAG